MPSGIQAGILEIKGGKAVFTMGIRLEGTYTQNGSTLLVTPTSDAQLWRALDGSTGSSEPIAFRYDAGSGHLTWALGGGKDKSLVFTRK